MDGLLRVFLCFCFIRFSWAFEYKVCATAEQESLCKWIEASRNEITCVRVSDSVDCLLKMQKKEADFGTFHLEEAFLAARFLGENGVVLAEVRHPDRADAAFNFETVAVVKSNMFGGLSALKGSAYCHPGFAKAQYWSDRVLKDFETRVLNHFRDDVKCNSAVRSAYEDDLYRLSQIFSKACRPGTWAVSDWWDKKLKRDYHTLCDQCEHPATCSYELRNKGRHSDALRCLTLDGGNVTYTALEFVKEYFELNSNDSLFKPQHKLPSRYRFLCPDGSTLPLNNTASCSWIKQPWTSVIATNPTSPGLLKNLREWLDDADDPTWSNRLRNILVKGDGVLKFRTSPITVAEYIRKGREIPEPEEGSCGRIVRWCTVGKTEKKKCDYLSTAALTHGLPIQLRCLEANSKGECLVKVSSREADVVYVDTELGFIARKIHNLTAAAYLETQRTGNYYGVVVVRGNSVRKLKDLKGKKACFPRYNGLGWLTYVEVLKSSSIIPERTCSNSKKVSSYFSQVCAPGAKDSRINPWYGAAPGNLCKGCFNANAGSSCEAASENPYFGEIGALRCLSNGDGDVAFLDFHAVRKHLGAQSSSDFNSTLQDFKVLCRDGSLEAFNSTNPDKCSFVQINGGEVVTRRDLEVVEKTNIHRTLLELDDLFGTTSRSYAPAIKMFEPFDGISDLLFKDSAVSLVSVYETQNRFVNNYIKLLADLDGCHDDSSSSTLIPSTLAIASSILFIVLQD